MFSYRRPPVWKMIKEAMEKLGGEAYHRDIISYIKKKYGPANENTMRSQITICTVNVPSRINFPENAKPRKCNSRYDFLYSVGRGEVVLYNPSIHGEWGIENIDGKLAVVQRVDSSLYPLETKKRKVRSAESGAKGTVYCPVCMKDVIIKNERSGRCPFCGDKISDLFERELMVFLQQKWNVSLKTKIVKIHELEKSFDLVSDDVNCIGDAKFCKSLDVPAAKWSAIAEYVWLLQFTNARNKFLIFGRDKDVPQRWLNRYRSLIGDVKFYFFDHKNRDLQALI